MANVRPRPKFDGNDALWRGVSDWMTGVVRCDSLAPARVLAAVADVAIHSGDLLSLTIPGRATRGAWREAFNKLRAFLLFSAARESIGPGGRPDPGLPELVGRVQKFDPYRGLWTAEGLGYFHASEELNRGPEPRGLLAPDRTRGIPDRCLIPLHTGMGLAFANFVVPAMTAQASRSEIRHRVDEFLSLCETNAAPGYSGAAIESLGLVVRNVRPRLVQAMGEELAAVGGGVPERFWHGFGRGLYFSPLNLLPCTSAAWPSVRIAQREPPHALGRSNALAGLAWAVTLVNIRDPEVIELFLGRHRRELGDASAFADGVRSAAAIWYDWAPGSLYLHALCRYRPRDSRSAERWDRYARSPCGEEFTELYRLLKRDGLMGELFRVSGPESPVMGAQ